MNDFFQLVSERVGKWVSGILARVRLLTFPLTHSPTYHFTLATACLFIGQSRDVKVTQRKTKDDKTNLRRNNANTVVLHDTDEIYKIEIENFKKEPVNLTLVEHIPGYWKMIENSHAAQFKKKDAFTFEYNLTLPAESTGEKKTTVTFNLNKLNVQGNEPASF